MQIPESCFKNVIQRFDNVLYLCHRNADPDAIGSAFALQEAFGGKIGAIDDLSRTGAALAKSLDANVLINPNGIDYDLVVVIDTSVRLQLGKFLLNRYAIIDHHLDKDLLKGAEFYIQRPCKSTSEIVWSILAKNGVDLTRHMALGLLIGIISDTGRFRRATPNALNAASELLIASKIRYGDALSILSVPSDISQRIAVLKSASRAEVERQKNWLLVTTEINSFEGSAAMALVDLGADVAFVAGKHDNVCRISARSSWEASKTGLNLADILRDIASAHGGEGGGHRAAAAMEAFGETSSLLLECKEKAREKLH